MRIYLAILTLLSACSNGEPAVCYEEIGIEALNSYNLKEAYELLKNCDPAEASGKALHSLHFLIFPKGFGSYPSLEDRIRTSHKLLCRSALKGFEASINSISFIYLNGDEFIEVTPNQDISECLSNIESPDSSEYVSPLEVKRCLSLNPSIDPRYQCN
jgi:hypothetical protein